MPVRDEEGESDECACKMTCEDNHDAVAVVVAEGDDVPEFDGVPDAVGVAELLGVREGEGDADDDRVDVDMVSAALRGAIR